AEAEQLEHGLLTYVLLRGMGEPGLRPIADLSIFEQYPTADLDHDGWVQTGELRQYADMTIPVLARHFPGLVLRGGAAAETAPPDGALKPEAAEATRPDAALTQEFEGASFPLIEIAPQPVRAGAR